MVNFTLVTVITHCLCLITLEHLYWLKTRWCDNPAPALSPILNPWQQPDHGVHIVVPILQMGKLRAKGHTRKHGAGIWTQAVWLQSPLRKHKGEASWVTGLDSVPGGPGCEPSTLWLQIRPINSQILDITPLEWGGCAWFCQWGSEIEVLWGDHLPWSYPLSSQVPLLGFGMLETTFW